MDHPVYNLHNHTPFSAGAYSIDEICEAHLALQDCPVAGIGVSDHLFCTPASRRIENEREFERVFAAETQRYVEHVHEARRRWAGKLDVVCGCEINWPLNKGMLSRIREMVSGMDYVLFECVDWAGLAQIANQARRWPCPIGLADTRVAERFPNTPMEQVVRTLANAHIFYEINIAFMPLAESDHWFQMLPRHRVPVTLGTDTHDDLACVRQLPALHSYAVRRELGPQLFVPEHDQNE